MQPKARGDTKAGRVGTGKVRANQKKGKLQEEATNRLRWGAIGLAPSPRTRPGRDRTDLEGLCPCAPVPHPIELRGPPPAPSMASWTTL